MDYQKILKKILDRLPKWFDKTDKSLLTIMITVLSQAISEIEDISNQALESMILQNSTDEFLEYWGEWYGIPRIMGESDLQYAIRILSEIKLPKQTIPSIKTYLSNILGIDQKDISVYEPFKDLIKLSDTGTLSGTGKLTDSEYWNWSVIDIKAPVPYNDYVRSVLAKIKAGGIKVFWSYLVIPEPNILDISSDINFDLFLSRYYYLSADFYNTFGLSNNDGWLSTSGTTSGREIIKSLIDLYFYPEIDFTANLSVETEYYQPYTSIGYGTQAYGSTWYGAYNPI